MVNRRDNGETIYNFLHYGLREVIGRPTNAFFGMSLVIDSNYYCTDFKRILEWFDYMFDKILNREDSIFHKSEDGEIQYKIHKFADNITEVEWIKSNLPNIFSSVANTVLVEYDNSFSSNKIGQIARFNDQEENTFILAAFKEYRWISISPEYRKLEQSYKLEMPVVDVEFDYDDLLVKLNKINQTLLPIAVDITRGTLEDLEKMSTESEDVYNNLIKYLPTLSDMEEASKFKDLSEKYASLCKSIKALIKILCQSQPKNSVEKNEENRETEQTNLKYSNRIDDNDRLQMTPIKCLNLIESKNIRLIIGLAVSVIVLTMFVVFLLRSCSKNNGQDSVTTEVEANNSGFSKEVEEFEENNQLNINELIENGDLNGAYECIKNEKDTAAAYMLQMGVENQLMSILDEPKNQEDSLLTYFVKNNDLLCYLGFTDSTKQYWIRLFKDYDTLKAIINKKEIIQSDYNAGKDIIKKYSDRFKNLTNSLDQCKVIESVSTIQDQNTLVPPVTTFTVLDGNNEPQRKTENKIGMSYKVGTKIKILCNKGAIHFGKDCPFKDINPENDGGLIINLDVVGKYVFRCGNVEITITAEKVKPRTH